MVKLKRVYVPYEKSDGFRILVDRLWPRGIAKESAHIDEWMKDIAPSNELRKWFSHDPEKWVEFKKRYVAELKDKSREVSQLKQRIKEYQTVTLLFAAKDIGYNNAVVLQEMVLKLKT